MSKALQDVLGWVALTKAIQAVKDGIPNPFPPFLFNVRPEDRIVGDSVKFNQMFGQRKAAKTARYGGAPHERALQREDLREAKFLHFLEKITFPPLILQTLRDYESYDNADKAKRFVANQLRVFGTLFSNSRVVAVATTLNKGA